MLETDGYVYLGIEDPVCAWNTYRGVLASANIVTKNPCCLSAWAASTIRRAASSSRVSRECNLEKIRRAYFPEKVSRSWGIYTFVDQQSAHRARAELQLPHMTVSNLAEISLKEATRTSIHDLNWITLRSDDSDPSWMLAYWNGDACPGQAPLWERLVEGHINVLGTDLRERAYERVKHEFPGSMCFLEISRIAAWVGSDLGTTSAFILSEGDGFRIDYYLNMFDANDPVFLEKIKEYMRSGLPVNRKDIDAEFQKESFGAVPDLRRFSIVKSKSEMPYLGDLL